MPLAVTVQDHAQQWVTLLGKCLNESTKEDLFSLDHLLVSFYHFFLTNFLNQ